MTATVEIPAEFSDGTITIRTHQSSDVHPYFEAARESIAEVSRPYHGSTKNTQSKKHGYGLKRQFVPFGNNKANIILLLPMR